MSPVGSTHHFLTSSPPSTTSFTFPSTVLEKQLEFISALKATVTTTTSHYLYPWQPEDSEGGWLQKQKVQPSKVIKKEFHSLLTCLSKDMKRSPNTQFIVIFIKTFIFQFSSHHGDIQKANSRNPLPRSPLHSSGPRVLLVYSMAVRRLAYWPQDALWHSGIRAMSEYIIS